MAQYKVPQDVEADDKLLGPFTFRQFVYLLIAAALVGILIFLFQLFPLLAIIPLPFILLFGALALPIKKDQPMETYLTAVVSYYLKPRTRTWNPGQRETTIEITAPKIVEDKKTRDITGEEATHRLSFLADIVDTQGQSVNAFNNNAMRDDLVAEAASTADMFENNRFDSINLTIEQNQQARHDELMKKMRSAIAENEAFSKVEVKPTKPATSAAPAQPQAQKPADPSEFKIPNMPASKDILASSPVVVKPEIPKPAAENKPEQPVEQPDSGESEKNISQNQPKDDMINLANNPDYSVATIAKEAKRIKERKDDGEVFVSLH